MERKSEKEEETSSSITTANTKMQRIITLLETISRRGEELGTLAADVLNRHSEPPPSQPPPTHPPPFSVPSPHNYPSHNVPSSYAQQPHPHPHHQHQHQQQQLQQQQQQQQQHQQHLTSNEPLPSFDPWYSGSQQRQTHKPYPLQSSQIPPYETHQLPQIHTTQQTQSMYPTLQTQPTQQTQQTHQQLSQPPTDQDRQTFTRIVAISQDLIERVEEMKDLIPDRSISPTAAMSAGKKRGRKPVDKSNLVCYHCNTRDTPEWRKGPAGKNTLCNACGLQYAKRLRRSTDREKAADLNFILNRNEDDELEAEVMSQLAGDSTSPPYDYSISSLSGTTTTTTTTTTSGTSPTMSSPSHSTLTISDPQSESTSDTEEDEDHHLRGKKHKDYK